MNANTLQHNQITVAALNAAWLLFESAYYVLARGAERLARADNAARARVS